MKKILSISDASALAMHTMGLLSCSPSESFTTKKLASLLHASEHHLSKVLQRLAKAGWIKSVRGPSGGFRISPGWERISLLQIYELMEGPFKPDECLLGRTVCVGRSCILGHLLKNVNSQIRQALLRTRLSDMIDSLNISLIQNHEKEGSS